MIAPGHPLPRCAHRPESRFLPNFLAALLVILVIGPALSYARPITVTGRVIEVSTEKGLPGVTVTLTDSKHNATKRVTDADGEYAFDDVAPGKADLAFSKVKYVQNPTPRTLEDVKEPTVRVEVVRLMQQTGADSAYLNATAKNIVAAVAHSKSPEKEGRQLWNLVTASGITLGQTSAIAKQIGSTPDTGSVWTAIPSFAAYSAIDTASIEKVEQEFKNLWLKEGAEVAVKSVASQRNQLPNIVMVDLFRKSLDEPTATTAQRQRLFKMVNDSETLNAEVKLKFVEQCGFDVDKIKRMEKTNDR